MRTRVLLVDDHVMMRDGLRAILTSTDGFDVVGEAADGHEAVAASIELAPEVVVMDVGLPHMNGIEACRRIRKECPDTRVVALSTHSDKRYVLNMIGAGASGYVLKRAAGEDLIRAVEVVARGEHYLSPQITGVVFEPMARVKKAKDEVAPTYHVLATREREVLQLLAEGRTSKGIAAELGLSTKTIETHRRNISKKLGLRSIAELTKYAVREGMTSLD